MSTRGMKKRDFLKKAGAATAGAVAATTLVAPHVKAQTTIKWRLQTYAGAALAEHVVKPAIDAFNKVANGEMVIELYTSDQLVPTGELFRAMQAGTIDAVQSDEDSMAERPAHSPAMPAAWTASAGCSATKARWTRRPSCNQAAEVFHTYRQTYPAPHSRTAPMKHVAGAPPVLRLRPFKPVPSHIFCWPGNEILIGCSVK